MLNGLEPVIIFQIYKTIPAAEVLAAVPLTSTPKTRATIAIVPIYLSENLTGLFIDTESKNIDIETSSESLTSGDPAAVNQKLIGSVLTINLKAKGDSVGLTILSAMAEQLLDKVTSKEYGITYVHGPITLFDGLLHGFSIENGGNDDLLKIKVELTRGRPKTQSVLVKEDPTALRLGTTGTVGAPLPTATSPTAAVAPPTSGQSQISPRMPRLD